MPSFSLSTATNLFKINYFKLSENMYNSANVTLARVKKSYTFTGKSGYVAVPLSFSGGVGSGSLPTPNVADYDDATISSKKVYSVVKIEREAIKASSNDQGAFVRGLKEVVKKGVESYMRNASRILFGSGDGSLGTIATGGVSGSGPWVLTISDATWKEANFEENDYVNIETANTAVFEITAVDPDAKTVTVALISGSQTPAQGDVIFMQNSENNDPNGLKQVTDATSSTMYGIDIARRWKSTQIAAGGSALTVDYLNELMLTVEKRFGKAPNMLVGSYEQYERFLNLLEDKKRYTVAPRYGSKDFKASVSFEGVEFMSSKGPIGFYPERFVDDDRVYGLNDEHIEFYHRPGFGWFDDDGTVFLRDTTDDYSARYGGYWQNYAPPTPHGRISGLDVT